MTGNESMKMIIGHFKVNILLVQMNPALTYELDRSSHSEIFFRKAVLKICSKFTGEHPCRNAISIKLQSNVIQIAFRHGCSPVNLLHIFRTPFLKNTSRRLLLNGLLYL